jgi:peptidoglycan/xylan/chitin deacetylase (PgdA/CDA1 family)
MGRLRRILEIPPPDRRDLPMTASEVAALAASGVFDFGGHTATHAVLPALAPAERRDDIRQGRDTCERLIGRPITGFAYPHGARDDDSVAAVRECGFAWACGTSSRAVPARGADRYALPRLGVLDWDGAAFERALQELRA